eukprot:NODE_291_length_11621_cov_0.390557.p3 type:complete len:329 gc:universal NODE_291_length_11621_cov_0.390557:7794-6808(-)
MKPEIGLPQHLNIALDSDSVEELLSKMFYHKYTIELSSGITNKLIKATSVANPKELLVRLYGNKTEIMIDRKKEIEYLCYLCQFGESPPIYYTFNNGLIYGYKSGFPLISYSDQEDSVLTSSREVYPPVDLPVPVLEAVVQKMARFHAIEPFEDGNQFENTMKKWYKELDHSTDTFSFDFLGELNFLLSILPSDVANSHNDLLLGNIILQPSDDFYVVHFIDFEYSFPNCRAFDLANFFNELCGFECNWSKFPPRDLVMNLICVYLAESQLSIDKNVFYNEVNSCILASHYMWGLWAVIQSDVSELDFDYKLYAEKRLARYKELKNNK